MSDTAASAPENERRIIVNRFFAVVTPKTRKHSIVGNLIANHFISPQKQKWEDRPSHSRAISPYKKRSTENPKAQTRF
jgi:hypothetical protein